MCVGFGHRVVSYMFLDHALCMFVCYMCVVGLCHRDVRYMLLDCGEKIQLNSHQLNKYVRLVRACVLVVEVVDYTRPQGVYGHVDYVWKDTHLQCLL